MSRILSKIADEIIFPIDTSMYFIQNPPNVIQKFPANKENQTVATLSPKTSAKYWGISITIVAKTQDLVTLARSNAHTGSDVNILFHGIFLACIENWWTNVMKEMNGNEKRHALFSWLFHRVKLTTSAEAILIFEPSLSKMVCSFSLRWGFFPGLS